MGPYGLAEVTVLGAKASRDLSLPVPDYSFLSSPFPPLALSLSLFSLSVLINHLGPPHLSPLSNLPDKKQTVSHHHALQAKNP